MHKQCPGRENWHSANTVPVLFLRKKLIAKMFTQKQMQSFAKTERRTAQSCSPCARFFTSLRKFVVILHKNERLMLVVSYKITDYDTFPLDILCCMLYPICVA